MKKLIALAITCLAVTACSGQSEADDAPAKQDVQGRVEIIGSTIGHGGAPAQKGAQCWQGPNEQDIVAGKEVTLEDGSGKLISIAELGAPAFTEDYQSNYEEVATCAFPFTFEDVLIEEGVYSIGLEGRGSLNFKSADLSQTVVLVIG